VFWGLLWGAILIVVFVIYRFVLRAVNRRIGTHPRSASVLTSMAFAFFCLVVVLLLVAGLLAARQARRLESGVAAGVLAAFLLALVELAVAVLDAYHARHQGTPSLGSPVLRAVQDFIALIFVGGGAGALGGLLGRGQLLDPPVTPPAPFTAPPTPNYGTPPPMPYETLPPADPGQSLPSAPGAYPDDFSTLPSPH
jgi:uncharacterized membrane protein YhaH (DUF805 family)